jgi:hypothetical protein
MRFGRACENAGPDGLPALGADAASGDAVPFAEAPVDASALDAVAGAEP